VIEFLDGRYRIFRADKLNIDVERWGPKGTITINGEERGGGEGWHFVGHYGDLEAAIDGMGKDAFMQEIGTKEDRTELLEFKRNLIKIKKTMVAEAQGIKLESQRKKRKGKGEDDEE
jgi:hypothetical protein